MVIKTRKNYHKLLTLLFVVVVKFATYSQCNYNDFPSYYTVTDDSPPTVRQKYEQLKLALLCIKKEIQANYTNLGITTRSISIIESPSFPGQFIFAAGSTPTMNHTEISRDFVNVIRDAIHQYYSTTFTHLTLLTGLNNELEIGYDPLPIDNVNLLPRVRSARMPSRLRNGQYRAAVHSELILMSYLQLYEDNYRLDPSSLSFPSDLAHCARCYNYLLANDYYVPFNQTPANTKANGDFIYKLVYPISNTINWPWSAPNYSLNRSIGVGTKVNHVWQTLSGLSTNSKLGDYFMEYINYTNGQLYTCDNFNISPFILRNIDASASDIIPPRDN